MEDRLTTPRVVRPGLAALTLLGILGITAGWWALALWPASTATPDWLVRTRAACFGVRPGGLPSAGGWILLVGEPIGMLGVLVVVWGEALRADLRRWRASRLGGAVLIAVPILLLLGLTWSGKVVTRALGVGVDAVPAPEGASTTTDLEVVGIELTDQDGMRRTLADIGRRPALLTFAFGRCTTVCPTLLPDLRRARRTANRPDIPIVVITVDPWRDTPARLATVTQHWQLEPGDIALSGSVAEVEQALDSLGVVRTRNLTTGDVDHLATVLLLESGRVQHRLDGGWGGIDALLAQQSPRTPARTGTP